MCTKINGQSPKVGCVAVAMAMVMSVTQNVGTFNNITLNWNEINKIKDMGDMRRDQTGTALTIKMLLRELGLSVKMKYGVKISEADCGSAAKVLTFASFLKQNKETGRRPHHVTDVLSEHSDGIVFVSARDRNNEGHAYVIDGYREYVKKNNIKDGIVYYHLNLGFGGNTGYIFSKAYGNDIKHTGNDNNEVFIHNMTFYEFHK